MVLFMKSSSYEFTEFLLKHSEVGNNHPNTTDITGVRDLYFVGCFKKPFPSRGYYYAYCSTMGGKGLNYYIGGFLGHWP